MSIKNKIFLCYILVFLTVVLTVYFTNYHKEKQFVCGVIDYEPKVPENLKEGKKLFKSLCASCHKLDKNLIGPALGQIKMDSIYFNNYLTKDTIHKPDFSHLNLKNSTDILKHLQE